MVVTITDVGFGGEGVGRHEDQVVFVPFVAVGEKVKVHVVKKNRRFLRAELVEVIEPSHQRVTPACPYFTVCGGCNYQHLNYQEQLRLKEEQIRQILKRIGKIQAPPVSPILASPESYYYRNRIVVHAEKGKIGFRARDGKTLVDIKRCAIASEEVNEKLKSLRQQNFRTGHYSLREDSLPPIGFYQTNRYLLEKLREVVIGSLPPSGASLMEGYCGNGFFTIQAAQRFKKVVAVDTDARSLQQAPALANVTWKQESIETTLARESAEVLLVDPTREGLNEETLNLLNQKSISTCVYVSCNPATLARDIHRLANKYVLKSVQPIDLFPQTAHIEMVAVLECKLS